MKSSIPYWYKLQVGVGWCNCSCFLGRRGEVWGEIGQDLGSQFWLFLQVPVSACLGASWSSELKVCTEVTFCWTASPAQLACAVSVLGSSITDSSACSSGRRPSQEWEVMFWSTGMQSCSAGLGMGAAKCNGLRFGSSTAERTSHRQSPFIAPTAALWARPHTEALVCSRSQGVDAGEVTV